MYMRVWGEGMGKRGRGGERERVERERGEREGERGQALALILFRSRVSQ